MKVKAHALKLIGLYLQDYQLTDEAKLQCKWTSDKGSAIWTTDLADLKELKNEHANLRMAEIEEDEIEVDTELLQQYFESEDTLGWKTHCPIHLDELRKYVLEEPWFGVGDFVVLEEDRGAFSKGRILKVMEAKPGYASLQTYSGTTLKLVEDFDCVAPVEFDIEIEYGKSYKVQGAVPAGWSLELDDVVVAKTCVSRDFKIWISECGKFFSPHNVDAEVEVEEELVPEEDEPMIRALNKDTHPTLWHYGFRSGKFDGDQLIEAYKKPIVDFGITDGKIDAPEVIYIVRDEDRYVEMASWNKEAAEQLCVKLGQGYEVVESSVITEEDL